jgi:hypothetical protein
LKEVAFLLTQFFLQSTTIHSIRSEVFTVVNILNVVFWVITVCMSINNLEEHTAPNYSSIDKITKRSFMGQRRNNKGHFTRFWEKE